MNEIEKHHEQFPKFESRGKNLLTKRLAMFSCWSVLVVPLVTVGCLFVLQNYHGQVARWLTDIIPILCALGILSGFSIGWVALIKNRKAPSKSVFIRSLVGISVNGLLILFFSVLIFFSIKDYREQSLKETPAERAKRLYYQSTIDSRNREARLHDFASRQVGDTNLAIEAMSPILKKHQDVTKIFYSAVQPINKFKNILDTSNVEKKEDLADRKEMLQKFLEANNQFISFLTNAEVAYKKELNARGVSQGTADYFITKFHEGWETSLQAVELYQLNEQLARNELSALSLLETNWESWSYDSSQKKTVFHDDSIRKEFNELVEQINRFTEDRKRLQEEALRKGSQ